MLVITRSRELVNLARTIHIYIDGEKVGSVGSGKTRKFELSPGVHQVKAKIDWAASREVPIKVEQDKDIKLFTLTAFKYAMLLPVAPVSALFYSVSGIRFFVIPPVVILGMMLYYITLGRKDYLVLQDQDI